jgi:uncharacterized lipoprotein YbaY
MSPGSALLTGDIYFDPDAGAPRAGVLHVIVEDVSNADRPAVKVAQLTLDAVWPGAGGGAVAFSLPLPALDPTRQYGLRVHADSEGDGRTRTGDQITVESIPVPPLDPEPRITARLKQIT